MKKLGLLLMLFVFLISCSNNDSEDQEVLTNYYGKWTYIDEVKDVKSPYLWTEYYIFNADHTFVKSRTTKDGTVTGKGTFEIVSLDNRLNFKLTYDSSTNLVYSCSSGFGGTSELLYLLNNKLENSAGMCDYFGTYKKEK